MFYDIHPWILLVRHSTEVSVRFFVWRDVVGRRYDLVVGVVVVCGPEAVDVHGRLAVLEEKVSYTLCTYCRCHLLNLNSML